MQWLLHNYAGGILEKLIKEITGHKSDCVCTYKCIEDKWKCKVSETLSKSAEGNVQTANIEEVREKVDVVVFKDGQEVKKERAKKGKHIKVQLEFTCDD